MIAKEQVIAQEGERRPASPFHLRRAAPLLILMLVCVVLFTALGVWQLQRLTWKLDLIAAVDARAHSTPVPIPSIEAWDQLEMDERIYQRVKLSGTFDHEAEVQTQAVTELGPGYWVMTPLLLDGAGIVLINRGFVPQALKDPASRENSLPAGRIDITGLLRATEPKGGFLRSNDPDADRWFSRDVAAIAEAKTLPEPVAPFFVDAGGDQSVATDLQLMTLDSIDSFPHAGMTVIAFRNTHLAYALTWFALAVMAGIGFYLVLREKNRK